jgi:hypothetical protein
MIISKRNFRFFTYYTIIGLFLFILHYFLIRFFPQIFYPVKILESHIFIYLITLIFLISSKIITRKVRKELVGYVFLASGLLKMFICVFYLFPIIRSSFDYRKVYIIQFFVIYFIYLFLEIFYFASENKMKD